MNPGIEMPARAHVSGAAVTWFKALMWLGIAANIVVALISIFYVPAAIEPLVHRYSAVISILCRFGGVAFFSIVGSRYITFGLFDLTFGFIQAILLWLAWGSPLRKVT
jgi:hypothetical protein